MAMAVAGNPISPASDLIRPAETFPRLPARVSFSAELPAGKSRGLGRRHISLTFPRRRVLNCVSKTVDSCVDVIGIGSRKDTVLDFCLESAFSSCKLNFWTIGKKDAQQIQLVKRSSGDGDEVFKNVEAPYRMHLSSQAVILVATAGCGSDHIIASEALSDVNGGAGVGVVIIVKPFSFEGRRRQQEVESLFNSIKESSKFCIVVDTDALLKTEAVTLSEALKSAHSAVLLAMNLIYVLTSEMYPRIFNSSDNVTKELKISELKNLLEGFDHVDIGFGSGVSVKASITKAVFECPFLSGGLKGLNDFIVCNLASVNSMSRSDLQSFVSTFRKITRCTCDIVVSFVHEPNLEDNIILTTILVMRKYEIKQMKSFFSNLASHFPFVLSFFGAKRSGISSDRTVGTEVPEIPGLNQEGGISYNVNGKIPEEKELQDSLSDDSGATSSLRPVYQEDLGDGFELSRSADERLWEKNKKGARPFFQMETISSCNFGPGFYISSVGSIATNMDTYPLPVGVKSLNEINDLQVPKMSQSLEVALQDDDGEETNVTAKMQPLDGLVSVTEIYNPAGTLAQRKSSDGPSKQGLLSSRAASMLESERGSFNKWRPVMEMHYRGGIYKGRCQGGLPEGKGRLTLTARSFYDGMWRYGMRSGLGTFCYPNGDLYQGSWRDDLIHGKGWFYFHTGDRWFSNFWKGKANGEGRFYSKSGGIFFGHFQDGWRHGQCLYIDSDGTRWKEIWTQGVLISRIRVDSEVYG